MAWAFERPAGKGRGFGFTGAHFHKNWQNDQFRKVVMNAICWTAGLEVPASGIETTTPTDEELNDNLDPKQPRKQAAAPPQKELVATPVSTGSSSVKPVASTSIISIKTPGLSADLEADITGAKELYLVVTDGGDGFGRLLGSTS